MLEFRIVRCVGFCDTALSFKVALDLVWKLELAVDHEWQEDSKDVGSNGIPDAWLLLNSDGVEVLEDWPGSYSCGKELDLFHITLPLKS